MEPLSQDEIFAFPMSFSQQRFWFLEQLESGTALYTIPAAVRIEGALDVEALAGALNDVVERHESLRTTFESLDDGPSQIVHPRQTRARLRRRAYSATCHAPYRL